MQSLVLYLIKLFPNSKITKEGVNMAWLEVDMNELNQETEKFGKGQGLPEPNVYEVVINECYLDKTQGGTVYFNIEATSGEFPNDQEIRLTGWAVERMIKNKDGQVKNSKGGYFTGVILLNKLAKCIGKDASSLTPTKKFVQVWNENKEVYSLNDLINKKVVLGIRHRKYEKQDGSIGTRLELVDVCCVDDNECKEKLKARIERKPIFEEKSSQPKPQENTSLDNLDI